MNIVELQEVLMEVPNLHKPVKSVVLSRYDCRYDTAFRSGVDEWKFVQKVLVTYVDDSTDTIAYVTKLPSTSQQYTEKHIKEMQQLMESGYLTKEEIMRLIHDD